MGVVAHGGLEWRLWSTDVPQPLVMPRRNDRPARWETVVVLWGWVAVRPAGGPAFIAPRGTVMVTDGRAAIQVTAEPLTAHALVVSLYWSADPPHCPPPRWLDSMAPALWRTILSLPDQWLPETGG